MTAQPISAWNIQWEVEKKWRIGLPLRERQRIARLLRKGENAHTIGGIVFKPFRQGRFRSWKK